MSIYGPFTLSACCNVPVDQVTRIWLPTGWASRFSLTTVTVKLHSAAWPQMSPAVQVTVVSPTGKVLPLGGLQTTVGGGLQPPLAELAKVTTAPVALVVATVRLDEQFNATGVGGRTDVIRIVPVVEPDMPPTCPPGWPT